jgi:hypothetical protein
MKLSNGFRYCRPRLRAGRPRNQDSIAGRDKRFSLAIATCFMLVSCLAYSSNLRMKATCSSKTSADFQRTTRRYIPEDRTLHNHQILRIILSLNELFSIISLV